MCTALTRRMVSGVSARFFLCAAGRANASCRRGNHYEDSGVASLGSSTSAGCRRGTANGGDDQIYILTQCCGNVDFVASWMSFVTFSVASNRAGVPPQRWASGARCQSACSHKMHADRRRVACARSSVRAPAAALSLETGRAGVQDSCCWRLGPRGAISCFMLLLSFLFVSFCCAAVFFPLH